MHSNARKLLANQEKAILPVHDEDESHRHRVKWKKSYTRSRNLDIYLYKFQNQANLITSDKGQNNGQSEWWELIESVHEKFFRGADILSIDGWRHFPAWGGDLAEVLFDDL